MRATTFNAMPVPPDITVASPGRRTILVVECRFSLDTSPTEAARQRNRLLTDYLDVSQDSFFMLALPSCFYLWKPGVAPDALPNYSASATPILRIDLGRKAKTPRWALLESMRFAVSVWLGELAGSIRQPGTSEADRMLVDVGLCDLMRGGTVERDIES